MRRIPEPGPIEFYFLVDRPPVGEAPLEVREQWVGLALPVRRPRPMEGPEPFVGTGVETREPHHIGDGVVVLAADALEALRAAGRDAAVAYWQSVFARVGPVALGFRVPEGRLLPVSALRFLDPTPPNLADRD